MNGDAVLSSSDLFRNCTPPALQQAVEAAREVHLADGELLFSDEDKADAVWVVAEGELIISKMADGEEMMIEDLAPGGFLGEISLLTGLATKHRARARGDTRLVRIPGSTFRELLRTCPSVMETVLRTMADRVRRFEHQLQQRERMAGLGTLAAGLAHELNNPAAAAHRSINLLGEELERLEPLVLQVAEHPWTASEIAFLSRLELVTREVRVDAHDLDPLTRSDQEEELTTWLEERGIEQPSELAALLVERGVATDQLASVTAGCDASVLLAGLTWTHRIAAIRQLIADAAQSTQRITEIVRAVKAYSYVDKTTLRQADVHEQLEGSLTILGHKLREVGASIIREYDRTLPPIQTYGTELAQVWTNLLDNAADAVKGSRGTIRLRTAKTDHGITVEIVDSGSGIAPEIERKIFDPFFTTKEAGKGTGLGLEIVKRIVTRHHGSIDVSSGAGETRFTVRLPLRQDANGGSDERAQ